MIVTIGGIKGGSGKTTVATNLACIAAGQGADVLLVDADNQETAFDFTNARKADNPRAPSYTCVKLTGASVRTEVLKMAKKYDHVIIDAGGRDTTSQTRGAVRFKRPPDSLQTAQLRPVGDRERRPACRGRPHASIPP